MHLWLQPLSGTWLPQYGNIDYLILLKGKVSSGWHPTKRKQAEPPLTHISQDFSIRILTLTNFDSILVWQSQNHGLEVGVWDSSRSTTRIIASELWPGENQPRSRAQIRGLRQSMPNTTHTATVWELEDKYIFPGHSIRIIAHVSFDEANLLWEELSNLVLAPDFSEGKSLKLPIFWIACPALTPHMNWKMSLCTARDHPYCLWFPKLPCHYELTSHRPTCEWRWAHTLSLSTTSWPLQIFK